ncbi:MAG TPA: hypothetical protein VHY37_12510 [Tepidisphaeraceae bacterium]|nr:hypothetical protein [Tepidisphaeraceae bacterium]
MSASTAIAPPTHAPAERAAANFAANCDAIKRNQPSLPAALPALPGGLEWILARDGSLTALEADGAWWAGCSLPWRAARTMFKSLDLQSLMGCFLSPGWAAQLRLCLDLIEPRQAIAAACPDVEHLAVMLHCEGFAEDIAAGRLWFAAGPEWPRQIEELFDSQPGLVVPTQFLRAMSRDKETLDAMIPPAQKAFAEINGRRGAAVEKIMASASSRRSESEFSGSKPPPLCIVCPSQFSLWQEAGSALAEGIDRLAPTGTAAITRLDSDRPTSASPLALAMAMENCDALLIPDAGRGDLPGIVAEDAAWITWVTRGGIPDAKSAGPRDRLLLADRSWLRSAIAAGWPAERTAIAEWPMVPAAPASPAQPAHLAIIADTRPAKPPRAVSDFSSQGILWEHIRAELLNDPFAVGDDVELFLNRLMRELEIAPEALDRRVFIGDLILPAYQHGLAKRLVGGGIPIRIFGKGWDTVVARPDCAALEAAWAGPLRSNAELRSAAASAIGLVHAWPSRSAHPIQRYGKPILGPSLSATAFLRDAARLLRGGIEGQSPSAPLRISQIVRSLAANGD